MPHKRNPVGCAFVLTAGLRGPELVDTLFGCMVQEHERALGGWQAEWDALPELAVITGGAVATTADIMAGLEVHADQMQRNLNCTQGLIQAEAVMLELGRSIGRLPAHELVEKASHRAASSQRALLDVLSEDPAVTEVISRERLAHLLDPATKPALLEFLKGALKDEAEFVCKFVFFHKDGAVRVDFISESLFG